MKKQGWKWLLGLCLIALLSVLPVEEILAYGRGESVETEYWEPFGNADFYMVLEWEKDCDYEVLETEDLGKMHSVDFLFSNSYKADVSIKVRSSNPDVIAIHPSYEEYTACYGDGDGRVIYTLEGYGVTSIIFDIEGHSIEKEIIVVPYSTDLEKIEKVDYNSIKLTWGKQPGVSGYIIERNDTSDKSEGYTTFKTTTNDANFMIIDVEWGKRYQYRVMPYINKGSKKICAEKQGKAVEFYLEKTVAEIKSIKQSGSSSLQISWNKVKGATGYKVYRSEYENEGYKCVYSTNANTTSWKQKVTKGQRYYYRVETIYPEIKGFSKSVAQLIPKYSAAKIVKLSGVTGLETTPRVRLGARKADEQYYYVVDGKLHIIEVNTAGHSLTDYTLNSKGKVTAKKKVDYGFQLLGTIYRANDGKFYVVSSNIYRRNDYRDGEDPVVLKITQYSSKWKEIKTTGITATDLGMRTDSSAPNFTINDTNCGFDMRDGEIYMNMSLFIATKRYIALPEVHEFKINCKTMEVEAATSMFVGEAIQQEVVYKDDGLYLLSHQKGSVEISGISDYPDSNNSKWKTNALPIQGVTKQALDGCGFGGMEVGNKNILVCGISARNENSIKYNISYPGNYKDVFLSVIDRETGKTTLKWLTSYNKKKATTFISDTRMIKLSEDRYAIIFSTTDKEKNYNGTLHYIVVNNEGKKIYSASYTGMRFTSASQPILYNGNIVWMEIQTRYEKSGKHYDEASLYQIPAIDDEDLVVGKTFTYKKQTYKITGKSTVTYTGTKDKKATKIEIPASVTYGHQTYKVTSIADKALAKNTKVKTVVIGTNVKEIGKSAFWGCKKLTTIEVKSKYLKKIGKSALKGISSKATIKVPKAKLTAYKKLFKGKGQSKKVKCKKA